MHEARDRNQGVWIEHSDRLYLAAYSSAASLVVTFSGYFRKMDGTIIEWAQTVEPTSDRVVTAKTVFFGAGFLLSCMATLTTGNASRGQCYVRAHVQRNEGTSAVKLANVIGGYVTDEYAPSFPFGKIEGSLEGPGMLRSVTGTNPAAGVEIAEVVPTGARWRLRGMRAILVTDATVANRFPEIIIDDGTNIFYRSPSADAITAGVTLGVSVLAPGQYDYTNSVDTVILLPGEVFLFAAWRIRTITVAIVAGDNWGAPQMLIEEWIEA